MCTFNGCESTEFRRTAVMNGMDDNMIHANVRLWASFLIQRCQTLKIKSSTDALNTHDSEVIRMCNENILCITYTMMPFRAQWISSDGKSQHRFNTSGQHVTSKQHCHCHRHLHQNHNMPTDWWLSWYGAAQNEMCAMCVCQQMHHVDNERKNTKVCTFFMCITHHQTATDEI